ncbi:MAG: 50S ribosomal protein P1, partial [Promethearchaeota archaeon]
DKTEITKLIAGLKGTKIDEIIKSAGAMPVMSAPAGGKTTKKKEEKKKEEEPEEEEEPTGIGSLF